MTKFFAMLAGGGSPTMLIILVVMLVVVIGFVIVTTITGRKASKKEKEKRYKVVRDKLKEQIYHDENRKNIRIEFERVSARKGYEYKYRDVFDVVVNLHEPKTQDFIETRAYEVEGITRKIDKKNYHTDWIINTALDLGETRRRIAINEKDIKLTKEEKKAIKVADKEKERQSIKEEKKYSKKEKQDRKIQAKEPKTIAPDTVIKSERKFVPTRNKK